MMKNTEVLKDAWSALQSQWRSSSEKWHDQVKSNFEREFWSEYAQVVPACMKEMQSLEGVLEKARQAMEKL